MSPKHRFHSVCKRWYVFPGNEESGRVEEVQKNLVSVTHGGTEILIAGGTTSTKLLGAQHSLYQNDMVI